MAGNEAAEWCVRVVIPSGCLCGSAMMVDGILCVVISLLRADMNVVIRLHLIEQPCIASC